MEVKGQQEIVLNFYLRQVNIPIAHVFYPVFHEEKKKKKKKGSTTFFWPKLAHKLRFVHFSAHFCTIVEQYTVPIVLGHARRVYDMLSVILQIKNNQKRAKNDQEVFCRGSTVHFESVTAVMGRYAGAGGRRHMLSSQPYVLPSSHPCSR